MILTKEQIEEQFLDTATDSHEKKYNEGFIDGFLLAQGVNKFDTNDVIEFMYKLFKHTPAGSLQKWELRHYGAFIEETMKNRIE